MLTRDELVAVMPRAAANADRVVPALDAALQRFDITTPAREAAFLSQLAHESGELRHWTENLNYRWEGLRRTFPKYFQTDADARAYERKPERIANRVYGGRMGNGPESSGDGWRYRGRGPIQLTGKDNYRACGMAIGVDLVNAPERLETPEAGCLAAGWFWVSRGLNALADAGDFVSITRKINGGLNGIEERTAFWRRAKTVFGVAEASVMATRGLRGMATPEAEQPAAPAPRKPVRRRVATAVKAGPKAKKASVATPKKTDAKPGKPRVAAAKKTRAKPAKSRVAATRKTVTKAGKRSAAAAKSKAAKAPKKPARRSVKSKSAVVRGTKAR